MVFKLRGIFFSLLLYMYYHTLSMLKKIELSFIEKAQKKENLEPTAYQFYTGNIHKLHTIMLAQCL